MDSIKGDAGKSNNLADREFWDEQWLSSHFEGHDLALMNRRTGAVIAYCGKLP
jgi:hypothetical protein